MDTGNNGPARDGPHAPKARHHLSDELDISFGANLSGGDATSPFGALDGNDGIFVVARYSF